MTWGKSQNDLTEIYRMIRCVLFIQFRAQDLTPNINPNYNASNYIDNLY